jgi:hypothetical protein
MAAAKQAADELSEVDWAFVGDADLLARVRELEALRRTSEAARMAAIAEVEARGLAVAAGARSTSAWLAAKTGVARGDANRSVQTARRIALHSPATRRALRSGRISLDHARVVASVMDALWTRSIRHDSPVTAEVRSRAEATLLDLAPSLDAGQLAEAGQVLLDRVDPEWNPLGDDGSIAEAARRQFTLTELPDGGGSCRGDLDPEGFSLVRAALSPLSAPRPTTAEGADPRTREQRWGDAFVELARLALASGELPQDGGMETTVVVTTTLESLRGEHSEVAPTLDTGVEVPVERLRRMACDALIVAAVLGAESQPLDIGRASRTVPAGMRRALVIRDGGCAFPGCGVKAAWTHAHHIAHWADGGATALSNLVLLCPHHHRLIHHSPWEVGIGADGLPVFTPPDWVTPEVATADPTWRVRLREAFPIRRPAA